MEKKRPPEQCIKELCKAIQDYCDGQHCPRSKDLSDVKTVYMVFFRTNGKARLHLIGPMSAAELMESTMASIDEMARQQMGQVDYVS